MRSLLTQFDHPRNKTLPVCLIFPVMFFFSMVLNAQTVNFFIDKKEGCAPMAVNFTDISRGAESIVSRSWYLGKVSNNIGKSITVGTSYENAGTYIIKLTITLVGGETQTKTDSVIVHASPIAAFTTDDRMGCAPHHVQLTNLSTFGTDSNTTWSWNIGPGISKEKNPSYDFNVIGSYDVKLLATNIWGCKSELDTMNNYIRVYEKAKAIFSIPDNYSCDTPFTAKFKNRSTGGGDITYYWLFGDGDSSVEVNPWHRYTHPGVYQVLLTARNGTTCTDTHIITNAVFAGKPRSSITAVESVCTNTPVLFSGSMSTASFNNVLNWKWMFPDGAESYGQNVSHSFKSAGIYDVLLITYYNVNCQDTAHHSIIIKAGPDTDFAVDKSIGCSTPFPVKFSNKNNLQTGLTYNWNFGDGATASIQNPPHTYINAGSFTVSLTITDTTVGHGCSANVQKDNIIKIVKPEVDMTLQPQEGCAPLPATARAKLSSIVDSVTSFIWDFGEGPLATTTVSNATHIYSAAGSYSVKLTIVTQQGCTDSSGIKHITVSNICNDDGSGDGQGGGGGGGRFTTAKSCAEKYTITFMDTVLNTIATSWDFGDGTAPVTNLRSNTITHIFPDSAKTYTVTVTLKDTLTSMITTSQKNIIIIDEKANFHPHVLSTCKDKMVSFITDGIDSSNIERYTWDFGDSTGKLTLDNQDFFQKNGKYNNGNVSHPFKEAGNYFVKLTIRDKLGCLDSFIYNIPVVISGPVAGFITATKTNCGSNIAIDFTDNSKPNGLIPINKYLWDFGNGIKQSFTSADSTKHQVYTNSNAYQEYNISLTVMDSLGCENTHSQIIKGFNPRAGFTSNDTLQCGVTNITFENNSVAYLPAYTWNFGDGASSISGNGTHVFTKIGTYDVTLVVIDNNGCKDSITKTSFIKVVKPLADFSVPDTLLCGPLSVNFPNHSSYAATYRWNFGDSSVVSTAEQASHLYYPGTYEVKLNIQGVSGCTDSIIKTVRISGAIGKLNTGSGLSCLPNEYRMEVTGKNISSYTWDYNDLSAVPASKDSIVRHVYNQGGKYMPTVILISTEGCTSILKGDPIIIDSIKAGFSTDKNIFCDSGLVQFSNQSATTAISSINTYAWNFGDGSLSNAETPLPHHYSKPGTYNVSLAVESLYGCRDTFHLQQPVNIFPHPTVDILGEAENCAGSPSHFEAVTASKDSISSYYWKLDGNTVGKQNSYDNLFIKDGTYHLEVSVGSLHECETTSIKNIMIHPLPVPIISHDTAMCIGNSIQLHASGGATYNWQPLSGLHSPDTPDPFVTPQKNQTYYVTVTSAFGCSRKDSVHIVVDNKVNLQHSKDITICTGATAQLNVSGNTQHFLWTPSMTLNNNGIANPIATPKQTTTYQVVGYSANTCLNDTGFVKVSVGNLPTVDLGADLNIDAGTPLVLRSVVSKDVLQYIWEPTNGLSCSSCANPSLVADKDISYKLIVRTENGCEATDNIKINVLCGKGATRIPDAFTPNGDGKNDVFYIMGYGIQSIKRLSIFTRWGDLVFSRENILPNDKNNGWNGLVNNRSVSSTTTFVYVADIICNEGRAMQIKGTILLVR